MLHRHVSLWVGCVWIWGFFGVVFIVVCRSSSVCNQPTTTHEQLYMHYFHKNGNLISEQSPGSPNPLFDLTIRLPHPRANRVSCETNPSMDALPTNRTWPPSCSHGTYQHKAITSRSRQLLMMGTWLPEKCWETIRREIKNTKSDI